MKKAEGILGELAASTAIRIEKQKQILPPEEMEALARQARAGKKPFRFEKALRNGTQRSIAVIAEIKQASPSKGLIDPHFDPAAIADAYTEAGADCLSVLTEPTRFLGSDAVLELAAARTSVPILRKDFLVDPYMIDQAALLGADAVLLIVSLLEEETLKDYLDRARALGMNALVECHDAAEIRQALQAGARILGINNRNLSTFSTTLDTTAALAELIPEEILLVAESGIHTPADARKMKSAGADALLIGEALMKAPDRKAALHGFQEV